MGFLDRFKGKKQDDNKAPESVTAPAPSGDRIIDLKKKSGIVLEKNNLSGLKAAVMMVGDRSGSMRKFFNDRSFQDLAERVLGIAQNLDDDGDVPLTFFDTEAYKPFTVDVNNYRGVIDQQHAALGHMGTTNYAAAIESVVRQYKASGASVPALVIFQTDGSPDNKAAAEKALCEAAHLPIFWQFIGFGNDRFDFLRKLDELEVPKKRVIDNAGFFAAGSDPASISDETLYQELVGEFSEWIKQAKKQGIIR